MPPDFLTTDEVALELNVTPATVRRWIDGGHLTAWRTPGGHRRVNRHDLERFLLDREGT